jgi:hypothetical protein
VGSVGDSLRASNPAVGRPMPPRTLVHESCALIPFGLVFSTGVPVSASRTTGARRPTRRELHGPQSYRVVVGRRCCKWAGCKAIRFCIVARPPATRFRALSQATRARLMRPPMRRSRARLARACIWSTPRAVAFLAVTARRMLVAERRQSLVILTAICGAATAQDACRVGRR